MNAFASALTLLVAAAATLPPDVLVLDRVSVVAVFTPDSEIGEAERDEEGFADFVDDFEHYRRETAQALRDNPKVFYADSSAKEFRFKGSSQPVSRQSLSGYGFIVYAPGHDPVLFRGVATDDDVLCALKRLAPSSGVTHRCE
ncbi:hypothetical protein [Arenimonas sp.]|uniref:hypothetical protein n=1 Tax=Arenimonas sp. TaxID=1872635 RepID=UPI0039E34C72